MGLTSEQVQVIYAGYGYFLLLLFLLFLPTPYYSQLVEFQGNDVMVIYQWDQNVGLGEHRSRNLNF